MRAKTKTDPETLRAFAKQCWYTHATKSNLAGMMLLYGVEQCDVCCYEIMAANSVNVKASVDEARDAGLTIDEFPPEEGGYCDAKNCVTCNNCYTELE